MKPITFILSILLISSTAFAQTGHEVRGKVIDSVKDAVAGASVKMIPEKGDSVTTTTDKNGNFSFTLIKGNRLTLTFSSIGYQGLIRHYVLDNDNKSVQLGIIILNQQSTLLNQVNIVGVNPVTFKEDTIEYKVSAYKVRDNAPIEDVIRKLPGVDVDANGNVTAQGKPVTKVRVNGKDFFDGDVQTATKNLPADIVENIQIIDDYGDQANLTGVKTGDPAKIMNITVRKDKNYGYTGQVTGGDGSDMLPENPGVTNGNRYVALVNAFKFSGEQQIALLGNVNNTNVNTFSFGSQAGPPAAGGPIVAKKLAAEAALGAGGKISAGSGGNFSSQASAQNGITDTHALGTNFRDKWSKNLSVYGSYSFADNTVFTKNNTLQQNTSLTDPGSSTQSSNETDKNINHRLSWNMEYQPDAFNYLKVSPSFSYANTAANTLGDVSAARNGVVSSAYNYRTNSTLTSPGYGFTALYNHRFKKQGRNLSVEFTLNSTRVNQYQNPVYNFTDGQATAPVNQQISTNNHNNSYGTTASYLEPLSQFSFLEFNYAFNRSTAANNKETNVLDTVQQTFYRDSLLSNQYNYTFTTNRFGLNYRYVQKGKYNYTFGLAIQPSVLSGNSQLTGLATHVSAFNIIPTAHFVYNFSRSNTFSFNYSGSSNQPNFTQLQPVTDFSNALYPVEGNPNLKPSFTNNLSVQYNQFDFNTGKILFINFSFAQTQNQVVTNTITYPAVYKPDLRLQNTYLTKYLNADGYYTASGFISYAKPWDNRKYTLLFNGTVSYTNNIGYLTTIDPLTYAETTEKNVAKNLVLTPGVRFRIDLPEEIDAQFLTSYAINRTSNSIKNSLTNASANVRTWNMSLGGKNYFHDWTLSYDYGKVINYGYAESVHATDPNILNMYLERRFMKGHRATIRLAAFDLFNENKGFSTTTTASAITQTNTNRLGRYYLATLTLRLQKFAGK
jgi:hypothetical protein